MVMREHACPKCGGNMEYVDDEHHDKYWRCLVCGKRIDLKQAPPNPQITIKPNSVPPKPATKNSTILKQYYDENKNLIIADLREMGLVKMLRKWHINRSTWYVSKSNATKKPKGLAVRWGFYELHKKENIRPAEVALSIQIGNESQVLLSDMDFATMTLEENNKFWLMVGNVIRNRGLKKI